MPAPRPPGWCGTAGTRPGWGSARFAFWCAVVVDGEHFIQAGFRDEVRIGIIRPPLVGYAVDVVGGFNDEPRFSAGACSASPRVISMSKCFTQTMPVGNVQLPVGSNFDGVSGVGNDEPALLDGVIAPEGDVGFVCNQAIGRLQGLRSLKRQPGRAGPEAGCPWSLRTRRSTWPLEFGPGRHFLAGARADDGQQDVAVDGVGADIDDAADAFCEDGCRAPLSIFFRDGANAPAVVIGEDIGSVQLGHAVAAVNKTAGDADLPPPCVYVKTGSMKFALAGVFLCAGPSPALRVGPAIVPALGDDVDFFVGVFADIGQKESAGYGSKEKRHGFRRPWA